MFHNGFDFSAGIAGNDQIGTVSQKRIVGADVVGNFVFQTLQAVFLNDICPAHNLADFVFQRGSGILVTAEGFAHKTNGLERETGFVRKEKSDESAADDDNHTRNVDECQRLVRCRQNGTEHDADGGDETKQCSF